MSLLGYQTVEQMEQLVADITGATSTQEKAIVRRMLWMAYDKAVSRFNWPSLSTSRETGFTAVSGNSFVYLLKDVGTLHFISPSPLTHVAPHEAIQQFFEQASTFISAAGVITHWTDVGEYGRKADIDTAEVLSVIPDSSSGETYDVHIHGRASSDDEVFETVNIVGSLDADTSATFSELLSVSTDGRQTGTFSVKGKVSGTTYATLGENERTVRYKKIRFRFQPTSNETVVLYYKKRVQPLQDDDQVPEIPVSSALIHGAAALMFARQRKPGGLAQTQFQLEEMALNTAAGEEIIQSQGAVQSIPRMRNFSHGNRGSLGTVIVNNG